MRETLKGIDYMLRTMTDQHRVDITDNDGSRVWRNERERGLCYRLRSRPWFHEGRIPEQPLLMSSTRETFDFIADNIATSAAALRGAVFRDLVLNMNDYPLDIVGEVCDAHVRDSLLQSCESTAIRLMSAVDRMRKERK